MVLNVGKYEYREFCDSYICTMEQLIRAGTDKEAINIWLDKDVKVLAIKRVEEEKANDLAREKKYVVRVNNDKEKEYRFYHVLTISIPKVDLEVLLKGARI